MVEVLGDKGKKEMKELDRDKLLEIVRIKLIGCQPCNGCELKNHCPLPQAHKQTKQLISQQERQVDGWYIKEKARELYEAVIKVGSCAKNWIEHDEDRYIREFKNIIRSIVQEIQKPRIDVLGCVKKWLEIKAKNQQGIDPYKYSLYQLSADIDHSDLLQRLLEGKEPYPPKEKEKE